MKTKRGYFTINNGYVTWFFYECNFASVSQALSECNIEMLDDMSILKLDTPTQEPISSNWPNHVRGVPELTAQLKKERLKKEGKYEY